MVLNESVFFTGLILLRLHISRQWLVHWSCMNALEKENEATVITDTAPG